MIRVLNVLSGVAILFTSIAYAHLIHRYYTGVMPGDRNAAFLGEIGLAGVIGALAFYGGCRLVLSGKK